MTAVHLEHDVSLWVEMAENVPLEGAEQQMDAICPSFSTGVATSVLKQAISCGMIGATTVVTHLEISCIQPGLSSQLLNCCVLN